MRAGTAAVAAGVLAVLALAGCSGGDGGDSGDAKSGAGAATAAGNPVAGAKPGQTIAPLTSIGTRRAVAGDTPVEVDLNEVRVSGQVMQVTFTARNAAAEDTGRWQIADYFSDGVRQAPQDQSSLDHGSVDGVYVIDTANAKRHLVARTADGACVCSGDLSATFVGGGEAVVLTATFKAPPEGTTAVDVAVPKVGTFAGVQVVR